MMRGRIIAEAVTGWRVTPRLWCKCSVTVLGDSFLAPPAARAFGHKKNESRPVLDKGQGGVLVSGDSRPSVHATNDC